MMNGYFDFNATAPLSPAAREALVQASDRYWQNPSSLYRAAAEVRHRLEVAREDVGEWLGVDPSRIVFTSGATEANNAVMAWAADLDGGGGRCLASAVEHPSLREPAKRWFGARFHELPVDEGGQLGLDVLESELACGSVSLVSIMAANNETGVIQPWREAADICRDRGVRFHCDAVQWVGKLPLDGLAACALITASGHKLGGPKGCGILVAPTEAGFAGQAGGPQEEGRRAGTENFPAIAGMLAALGERITEDRRADECARWRDRFEDAVRQAIPGVEVIGAQAPRLWNTSMLVVPEVSNLKWLTRLDRLGFQVSTGSACSAGKGNPSHVMAAMGLNHDRMGRVLRISAGWTTRESDWQALAGALAAVAAELQDRPGQRKISLADPDRF